MSWVLAAAAAPSVIKGIGGLFGIGKGNRMAKNNPFPVENVNENFIKNAAMADQMAQVGLPQQQYNNAQNNFNRNLAGGLTALGRSANSSAGLASIVRAGNDATNSLDAQDAAARQQNQRFAFGQRAALANEQNRVWDWNNRQKYLQQAKAASETINAGKQNAFGGLTDLSQLGQAYLGGGLGNGGSAVNNNVLSPLPSVPVYNYQSKIPYTISR